MNEIQINILSIVSGSVELQKSELLRIMKEEFEVKPPKTNQAIKAMVKERMIETVERDGKIFVRVPEPATEKVEVQELKKAPVEDRVRAVLQVTEEEAEGLDFITFRTPPVKANIEYPDGVSKEVFEEFKTKILENKSLLWDLVSNFNGAKNTAITMWLPEDEESDENGRRFFRWDTPCEGTWELMTQLCRVIDLYNAQEAKAQEEVVVEE